MTYFLYNKKNKKVKMVSDTPFKNFDIQKMKIISKKLTKDEKEKLKNNYTIKYKNGLKFEKPQHIIKFESAEALRKEIAQADTVDKLKNILNKLI